MKALQTYAETTPGFRKDGLSNGGEWHGPCPLCGGKDRFCIMPNYSGPLPCRNGSGRYFCRKCGISGDGVKFEIEVLGCAPREVLQGHGLLSSTTWRPPLARTLAVTPSRRGAGERTASTVLDVERWRASADAAIRAATLAMVPGCPAWTYALGRGFTPESIRRFRFGYLSAWCKFARSDWGLQPQEGRPSFFLTLGGPGLLIPSFDEWGRPHKVKARAIGGDGKGPKYLNAPGGGQTLSTVSRRSLPCVLVEGELDALLLDQECGDLVGCVAMGGTTNSLDEESRDLLRDVPLVLDCLDNDAGGDKLRGLAAPHCPHGMRPLGLPRKHKDPGDAFAAGVDLRGLVWAALERERALPEGAARFRTAVPADLESAPPPEDGTASAGTAGPHPPILAQARSLLSATVRLAEDPAQPPHGGSNREGTVEDPSSRRPDGPLPSPLPDSPLTPPPAATRRPSAVVRTAPPAPAFRVEYVSPLVNASREAYLSAPGPVREALEALARLPDFFRLDRNAWSRTVGAWTRDGDPCPSGNALLAARPEVAEWTRSLRAQCWQPWEGASQWFTPEELKDLGVGGGPGASVPLPPALRRSTP